ncbi:MAG TPA: DUF11 domain-containing protein [Thiolinea sp.]|nr:DUF11 domain-containing protein [Thiolinea sp.]
MNNKAFLAKAPFSLLAFTLLLNLPVHANPDLYEGVTNTEMETILSGPSLAVSNLVVSRGNSNQYGLFQKGRISVGNGAVIGIDSGLYLSTGDSGSILGPNATDRYSMRQNVTYADPDLTALSIDARYDPVLIEFEVVPQGSRLNFVLTFGSEEYPEYVCSQFNDAFGLFVSGPGLSGVRNAAYYPGTTDAITVNNINAGVAGSGADGTSCIFSHSNAFNDNGNGTGNVNTQLDGVTRPMTAYIDGLTPNQSYHVKLALADAGDGSYDSAAFFKWLTSTVTDPVDLSLSATPLESSPYFGSTTTIQYTVSNHSAITNEQVQVLLELGDGFTHVSDDSNGAFNSQTGEWNVGELGANASKTLTLQLQVNQSGSFSGVGEVSYAFHEDPDSTPYNRDTFPNEDDTAGFSLSPTTAPEQVKLQVRALLQGPFAGSTGLMRDRLRVLGLIPLNQPYTATPFNYSGTETTTSAVLAQEGNDAAVDWVLVQLRAPASPTTLIAQQAALLQSDGDIVNPANAGTTLNFIGVPAGSYLVSIRHRNHLGVTTSNAVALSDQPALIDFSLPATGVRGLNARRVLNDKVLLWAGDANIDDRIIGIGPDNDTNKILADVLRNPANTGANANYRDLGYRNADLNLDGAAVYAGADNDSNLILGNVLIHPGNTGNSNSNYIIQGSLP